ncbi:MAG: endonuclease/exonuclease/phosphatase family protein [Tannerellaceae bacterium]|nr:endonuclease/exonuclease/phosphatase family protein [Tannerellaceae bacterium]
MKRIPYKRIVNWFFVVANLFVALLLVASAYSDRLSPARSLLFSYLGLVFPFICILNVCFVVYWICLLQWRFVLIGVGAFVVCWNPVKSYFPFHLRTDPLPAERVIKVLTYNVMSFAEKDHTADSPNMIVQYIADSDADIVCMQEYFVGTSAKRLTVEKLNKALHMYPYHSTVFFNNSSKWGLAVYSKYPISASRRAPYKSRNNGSSIHEIDIDGKRLTLINNHLESFKLTAEDRSRYSGFIKGVGPETFGGLRGVIQQKLGPAFLIRAKQADVIAEEIRRMKSDYILVCGDFNDTPVSYTHRTVQGALKDAFAESGRGAGVTYNQNFFWFRIDHILHSSNMKAINCTIDKVKYSDHYPVWCYFALN